ncbi:hypothetical protein IGI96_003857 [Enterococcus sp. DIV0421]|uniref:hypothetical protein n=1 Tax=Enterococcus sp. DIV0421 TaxID=2774688 RepID=UPI003F2651CB
MEQELVRENIINELYEGELTFEHADPTKKYLIVIKFLDGSKREFVGPDNKPLELEKEVMLGKEEGKVHLVLKGTKTMFKHIQKLKDVRVTAEIIDKN